MEYFAVKMQRDPLSESGQSEIALAAATQGYCGLINGFHTWDTEANARRAVGAGKRILKIKNLSINNF